LKSENGRNRIKNRREERQRQICHGAMKIFRKKGFNATTMREIANASEVSLGNLYNYIHKKEDILFLIHNDVLNTIYREFDEVSKSYDDPVEQLVNVVGKIYDLTCQLKDEMLFIYTETKSLRKPQMRKILQRESQFVSTIESLIKKVGEKGEFRHEDPDLIANLAVFTLAVYPLRGWNIFPRRSKEELRESLIQFVMKGVGVPVKEISRHIQ
jgi:AcrR family transcriptional regulator